MHSRSSCSTMQHNSLSCNTQPKLHQQLWFRRVAKGETRCAPMPQCLSSTTLPIRPLNAPCALLAAGQQNNALWGICWLVPDTTQCINNITQCKGTGSQTLRLLGFNHQQCHIPDHKLTLQAGRQPVERQNPNLHLSGQYSSHPSNP